MVQTNPHAAVAERIGIGIACAVTGLFAMSVETGRDLDDAGVLPVLQPLLPRQVEEVGVARPGLELESHDGLRGDERGADHTGSAPCEGAAQPLTDPAVRPRTK